jgi:hypothetical protein
MPKGFYTQGLAVLLEQAVDREEIARLLSAFEIVQRLEGSGIWALSGPALVLAFRPEVDGRVTVDVVDRPWPDGMGDSKEAPELLAAWSMGHFGPFTHPGGLGRALRQPWTWREARGVVGAHGAFLRIRMTYVAGMDRPVKPEDCDPVAELQFLTSVALALLEHPRALAYFDPNGEVLLPKSMVQASLAHAAEHRLPPFDLWSGVRLYKLEEGWILMDSVGNGQLDVADHEVVFPHGRFEPQAVDRFLRDMSLYLLENGPVIEDRDTADGPGGVRWQARLCPESLTSPPREVLRWFPEDQAEIPDFLFAPEPAAEPAEKVMEKPAGKTAWVPAKEPKAEPRKEPVPVAPPALPERPARKPWWKIW